MSKIAQSQETVQGLNLGGPYSTILNHLTSHKALFTVKLSQIAHSYKLQGHSLP